MKLNRLIEQLENLRNARGGEMEVITTHSGQYAFIACTTYSAATGTADIILETELRELPEKQRGSEG